jgi:hypothetical protein
MSKYFTDRYLCVFIILLLLPLFTGWAAPPLAKTPFRAEQALDEESKHHIIPFGQLGVIVASNASICFYDENLSLRWATKFSLNNDCRYVSFRMLNDSLHFAITSNNQLLYMCLSLLDGKGRANVVNVFLDDKTNVENAQMYSDRLMILAANNDKHRIIKHCYNSDTFFVKEIPLPDNYVCRSSFFDTAQNKIYVLFGSENYRDDALLLAVCDTSLSDISIKKIAASEDNIRIVDGKISMFNNRQIAIGGIWNYNDEKQEKSSYYEGTQSTGIYFALCLGDSIDILFKTYIDFRNSNALSSEALTSALERTKKGDMPALLAGLQVVPYKNSSGNMGLAVLAEAFERKFSTQTDMYYDIYGSMVPYTRTIYEGLYFVDVFCGMFEIDSNGIASGDNSFAANISDNNISALKSSYYVFNVNVEDIYQNIFKYTAFAKDSTGAILYAFPSENRIYYRVLPTMQGVANGRLNIMYSGDKVQKSWNNRIVHWYDNCFLGYGYQQILNYKVSRSPRNVFYLNKLLMGWR